MLRFPDKLLHAFKDTLLSVSAFQASPLFYFSDVIVEHSGAGPAGCEALQRALPASGKAG